MLFLFFSFCLAYLFFYSSKLGNTILSTKICFFFSYRNHSSTRFFLYKAVLPIRIPRYLFFLISLALSNSRGANIKYIGAAQWVPL